MGGPLTEEVVKNQIQSYDAPEPGFQYSYNWNAIQIAGGRAVNNGESVYQSIPHGTTVYPVRVDYVRTQVYYTSKQKKHVVAYYLFYKDEFGNWTGKQEAHAGTISEPVN